MQQRETERIRNKNLLGVKGDKYKAKKKVWFRLAVETNLQSVAIESECNRCIKRLMIIVG